MLFSYPELDLDNFVRLINSEQNLALGVTMISALKRYSALELVHRFLRRMDRIS